MYVMMGNLSVRQIEERLGIDFPEDVRQYMTANHQSEATHVKPGKWHCFDLPFHIVCGDRETATLIYNSVKDRSAEVREPLTFSIQGD